MNLDPKRESKTGAPGVVIAGVAAGIMLQLALSRIVAQWAYANGRDPAGWQTLFGFTGFEFRLLYLAVGAALFALFKGCADYAAIASVFR